MIRLQTETNISNSEIVNKPVITIMTTKHNENKQKLHQKTLMLLTVSTLMFIAELPQAILLLISIFSKFIYSNLYKPLGDFLDVFVLIAYTINFLIYCSMSKLFRDEFYFLIFRHNKINNNNINNRRRELI